MEKNQRISDIFDRIREATESLGFLYEASRTDSGAGQHYAFAIAAQSLLKFEIANLNEVLTELADEFDGLTYQPVQLTNL